MLTSAESSLLQLETTKLTEESVDPAGLLPVVNRCARMACECPQLEADMGNAVQVESRLPGIADEGRLRQSSGDRHREQAPENEGDRRDPQRRGRKDCPGKDRDRASARRGQLGDSPIRWTRSCFRHQHRSGRAPVVVKSRHGRRVHRSRESPGPAASSKVSSPRARSFR